MSHREKSVITRLFGKLASRKLIERTGTEINPVLEVMKIGDRIMLNSANTNYSFGGLHRVFQKALMKTDVGSRKLSNVLILGFGAGSVAAILQEELELDCSITGVEKDPGVIRLGQRYFNTGRFRKTKVVEADAYDYLRATNDAFDLIVVDVYVDFEVPASCQSDDFIRHLERCLLPGGLILFNKLVYNHNAQEEARELLEKFKQLNGKTQMIRIKQNIVNRIIVYEDRRTNNEDRTTNIDQ